MLVAMRQTHDRPFLREASTAKHMDAIVLPSFQQAVQIEVCLRPAGQVAARRECHNGDIGQTVNSSQRLKPL